MTRFGRALGELQIEIPCASSSQAEGRVERASRTLQDRLAKELRLAGLSGIEATNAVLPGFAERANARFAVTPLRAQDLHPPLNVAPDRLRDILCLRDQRRLCRTLTIAHDRMKLLAEDSDLSRSAAGQHADVCGFADGQLQVRHKGMALPFRIFDPRQQRVTHAAITETKRLSAVLAHIMAEQEKPPPAVTVPPSSAHAGYRKKGGRHPGRPSRLELRARKRAETAAGQASD
ncbi:hypothetical protein [Poseidonocella sp. HB161398]|uniref:hypothetical protein n=1 Tax=Poseidonocella sp. HB161398 TaxID=2320855 RepID=UPI003513ED61